MKKYSAFTWACCGRLLSRLTHTDSSPRHAFETLFSRCAALWICSLGFLLFVGSPQADAQNGYAGAINPNQDRYAAQTPTYQYPAINPPNSPAQGGLPTIGNQTPSRFPASPFQAQSANPQSPILFPPDNNGIAPPPATLQTPLVPPPQSFPGSPIQPGVLDLDVTVPQTQSQRIAIGGTYGSDNSLVGQLIFDEKDFDIWNWPRCSAPGSVWNAWKGGGQHFRVEAVPGNELQRYLVSWSNPYFLNSDYSVSLSGYLFGRNYTDFDEQRAGGRVAIGRQLTDYLSVNYGLRMESVTLENPRVMTSPELNADLGTSNLYLGSIGLVYDTRVQPYLTGVGSYLGLKFTQGFGDYSYSRGDIDFRNFHTIYQRPDGSGRHLLEWRTKLGFTGSNTPVFENYIAGGMSSMRGFEFRGISPIDGGVRVGGEFQWLNSLEYSFPLTQGDMIQGVMFVDFGTVEETVKLTSENFRAAPGMGLRVHLPYAGLGAPLAFDFAYPVATADGDAEQTFGFLIGVMR